jgi:O-antigen/teichoic acid export membrane protein
MLGVYGIALTFADLPRNVTNAISGKVIFPAISKLTDLPRPEIRAKLLHNRKPILLGLVFGLTALVCFGDVLVKFLYDKRYIDAAWMLPILALGIWPRMLCNTNEPSLFAIGKPQYSTFGQVTRFIWTSVGVILGFHFFKVPGAIIAIALNDLFYYLVVNYGLWREGTQWFNAGHSGYRVTCGVNYSSSGRSILFRVWSPDQRHTLARFCDILPALS